MKIFIKDENGKRVYDKNREWKFIELWPCDECHKHIWIAQESFTIQKSVELIRQLADAECELFHAAFECDCRFDCGLYRHELDGLVQPLKEICEYDSHEVAILKGVLQLAAFAGTSYIKVADVIATNEKIKYFIAHIEHEHQDNEGKPIAPFHWFGVEYPDWTDPEELLYFLPATQGKSEQGIPKAVEGGCGARMVRCGPPKWLLTKASEPGSEREVP